MIAGKYQYPRSLYGKVEKDKGSTKGPCLDMDVVHAAQPRGSRGRKV